MSELFKPWQWWSAQARGETPFLIEGLLHDSATNMSGIPYQGKTTLAAAMAAAVAGESTDFLGRTVRRHGAVMVACTDPSETKAWGQRMEPHNPTHDVLIMSHSRATPWDSIYAEVVAQRPALFILDNTLGSISGEIRSNEVASSLLQELDRIIHLGVAVLLIAHSSARVFEDGSRAKGPMGSTAYDAWGRLTVHVEISGHSTTLLSIKGNDCSPCALSLDVQFGDGREVTYSLNEERVRSDARPRAANTKAKRNALLQERIIGNPDLAEAGNRRAVASALGVSFSDVQRAMRNQPLVFTLGDGWSLAGADS